MDIFRKLKDMQIMLVDDDEWIRDSLSIYFESEDCRISAYASAENALEELYSGRVDVIITDYKLPGMYGITFLENIQHSHPDTVKNMITAYASEVDVRRAKQAGAQDLIPKPFTSKTIVACLTRLTANKGSNSVQEHKTESQ